MNMIIEHYQGNSFANRGYIDYNALILDMEAPKGAQLAPVFPSAQDKIMDDNFDDRVIKEVLSKTAKMA